MPGLGVFELASVLQKSLVADHDHMALAIEIQVLLIVSGFLFRLDRAVGIGNLQLQGLFDERVDRMLGDIR